MVAESKPSYSSECETITAAIRLGIGVAEDVTRVGTAAALTFTSQQCDMAALI